MNVCNHKDLDTLRNQILLKILLGEIKKKTEDFKLDILLNISALKNLILKKSNHISYFYLLWTILLK